MDLESNYLKKELYELVQSDAAIFDFLQNGSLDGIWYWDLENPENEWMSPRLWEVLGHDPKDKKHLASEWQDLINPEDLKMALDNFEKHCVDPEHPYDQVVRYRHSDGSTVWVRCRGIAIRDKSGKPIRLLGAHTELTRQKRTEEELRKSESLLASFTEALPDVSFIYDEDGRYVKVFATQTDLLIADPEILEGKTISDVLPSGIAKDFYKIIHDTITTNQTKTYEYKLSVKAGEKWFQARTSPMKTEINGKKAVVWIALDITDRKQSENKVRENEERLQKVIQDTNAGYFFIDRNGYYREINEAWSKMHRFNSIDDAIGRHFSETQINTDVDQANEIVESLLNGAPVPSGEFSRRNNDNTIGYHNFSVSPVEKNGEVIGLEGFLIDTTEKRQIEEQIKASLKEKETLLQEIHHRVKNNLTVVSSLLKLHENSVENDQVKEALKESQGRIYAMSTVHEALYNSKNLAEIDLKTYLSKISSTLIQTYSVNHGKVRFNIEGDGIILDIEKASPVGLIINELISNSLKYAFPNNQDSEINVSMRKLDNELELNIMDNGIGMQDGFDWRKSNTLGLKLVRTLTENQLDGSIDMESNNGTKFTIKFNIET